MPFAQIAKHLNVSTGMVRIHYQKLVEKGALQIAAITNPMYVGRSKMAMIGIKIDGSQLKKIVEEISSFDEVIYLVFLTGNYDLLAEIMCSDKEQLLHFLTEKLYKVKGVISSETFMYLDVLKEDYI